MEDKTQVIFWVDEDMRDKLDRLANDRGLSRSAYLRLLISDEWRRVSVYGYELKKKESEK